MPNSLRLALVALVLAGIFAGLSILNAMRVEEVQPAQGRESPDLTGTQLAAGQLVEIKAAVSKDPFNPTRTAPATRYRLPGEAAEVPLTQPSRGVQLRFHGAILSTDSSLSKAWVQLGNLTARGLRPGEKLGDYTLAKFDLKTATFLTASGDSLVIRQNTTGTTPR